MIASTKTPKLSREFVKALPPWMILEIRDWVEQEQDEEQKCRPINGNMVCNFTWDGITPVRNASGKPRVFRMSGWTPSESETKKEEVTVKATSSSNCDDHR